MSNAENTMKPSEKAYLLFRVAHDNWAMDVAYVQRVLEHVNVQSVPGTQPWFLGLAQVDGRLLPVTDLGAWLHQSPSNGAVLHVHVQSNVCGLRVDEVIGTQTLAATAAPLDAVNALMPGALSEAVHFDAKNYRLVNMQHLVQSPAFVAIREASPA